jgi:hypothetical protein
MKTVMLRYLRYRLRWWRDGWRFGLKSKPSDFYSFSGQRLDRLLLEHVGGARTVAHVTAHQWTDHGGGCATCGQRTPGRLR